MPKSSTLGTISPSGVLARKMFCGFRSRWTTPDSWAANTPAHTASITSAAKAGSAPRASRVMTAARSSPRSNSITR